MESRKIQKSGTTHYVYLPASWCREHNISTDSVVYLEKSSKGDLVVSPKKTDTSLASLNIELEDNSPEVINKTIIASYINPIKDFKIELKDNLLPDQVLEHKKLLGGLELVDFDESIITCHTSLALSDPDILLSAMIRKILSITKLLKDKDTHELIDRYEEEIDKSNLLIHKSIITTLMYKRESKLRHIDLFYIGMISRYLEQINDILITVGENKELVLIVERMMKTLFELISNVKKENVVNFIKEVEDLDKIEVSDLKTYKTKRIYALLGHIAEILCDWQITNLVDKE